MSEITKLNLVRDYWKHAEAGLADEFARMRRGFQFYVGDQWDPADLEKLAREKRPALTINQDDIINTELVMSFDPSASLRTRFWVIL